MPRPRFDKLDPERQEALLDAAMRELAARGPEGASLNKVLADVGLSKGVAYYYFDDREDLFVTVISRVVDLAVRTIGGVGPIDSPKRSGESSAGSTSESCGSCATIRPSSRWPSASWRRPP